MWLKGREFKGENSCLDIVLLNCGCDCLGVVVSVATVLSEIYSHISIFNTLN